MVSCGPVKMEAVHFSETWALTCQTTRVSLPRKPHAKLSRESIWHFIKFIRITNVILINKAGTIMSFTTEMFEGQ